MNKKIIIYLSILLMAFLSVIGVLSYAYFSASVNTSNAAIVNTTLPNGSYTFTTTNAGSINISFSSNKMLSSAVSTTAISSGNTNIEVSLTSPDANSRVVCTYDLVWEWTSTDKYTTSDVTLPYNTSYKYEMSVQANSTTTGSPSGVSYGYDNQLNETDLSKFTWSSSKATILTGASIVSSSKTTPTVTKWNITQKIYNLPVAQPKLQGKNFKSKVYASNVNCDIVSSTTVPVIISGNLTTMGSEVKIGTENFYVIGNDESNSSNVKLLAKYNLKVGKKFYANNISTLNTTEIGSYLSNETGYNMQSSQAIGYITSSPYWNGTVAFDETDAYVKNYDSLMNHKYGIMIFRSSLLTYDDLDLICDIETGVCPSEYTWLYNSSYWTKLQLLQYVYGITTDGTLLGVPPHFNDLGGVRPYIVVSKSIF